jgi:hypothetical protein
MCAPRRRSSNVFACPYWANIEFRLIQRWIAAVESELFLKSLRHSSSVEFCGL